MFAFSPRAIAGVIIIAATWSGPVVARDWPNAGKWIVAEAPPDRCGMVLDYDGKGETELVLSLTTGGEASMSLTNSNWTSDPDQTYNLTYYVDGVGWSGVKSSGYEDDGKKGFFAFFGPTFLKHFAASSYLRVESKDGTVIDNLDLAGSGRALAEVRQCLAQLRTDAVVQARHARQEKAEALRRARAAGPPEDPFKTVKE